MDPESGFREGGKVLILGKGKKPVARTDDGPDTQNVQDALYSYGVCRRLHTCA